MQIVEWRAIPIYVSAFIIREYSFWIVNAFTKHLNELESPLDSGYKRRLDDNYDIDMTMTKVSEL
jgi:hypothetical protein